MGPQEAGHGEAHPLLHQTQCVPPPRAAPGNPSHSTGDPPRHPFRCARRRAHTPAPACARAPATVRDAEAEPGPGAADTNKGGIGDKPPPGSRDDMPSAWSASGTRRFIDIKYEVDDTPGPAEAARTVRERAPAQPRALRISVHAF